MDSESYRPVGLVGGLVPSLVAAERDRMTAVFGRDGDAAVRRRGWPGERPADPDARIPDVPAFRHVMISEPDLGMLYIAPHLDGLHDLDECAAVAVAFARFIEAPERPSTAPIPEGRWWCSVDAGGLFELGGRCPE